MLPHLLQYVNTFGKSSSWSNLTRRLQGGHLLEGCLHFFSCVCCCQENIHFSYHSFLYTFSPSVNSLRCRSRCSEDVLEVSEKYCTNLNPCGYQGSLVIADSLDFVGSSPLDSKSEEKFCISIPRFIPIIFFPLSLLNVFLFKMQINFYL